jgi:hypothetical protein
MTDPKIQELNKRFRDSPEFLELQSVLERIDRDPRAPA